MSWSVTWHWWAKPEIISRATRNVTIVLANIYLLIFQVCVRIRRHSRVQLSCQSLWTGRDGSAIVTILRWGFVSDQGANGNCHPLAHELLYPECDQRLVVSSPSCSWPCFGDSFTQRGPPRYCNIANRNVWNQTKVTRWKVSRIPHAISVVTSSTLLPRPVAWFSLCQSRSFVEVGLYILHWMASDCGTPLA